MRGVDQHAPRPRSRPPAPRRPGNPPVRKALIARAANGRHRLRPLVAAELDEVETDALDGLRDLGGRRVDEHAHQRHPAAPRAPAISRARSTLT